VKHPKYTVNEFHQICIMLTGNKEPACPLISGP